ncbi:MAG: nucleotidyltransferase family protein [Thermoleophilaceae bacterium]|jgi:CTP:molybdopterin cytidylyltransferase MocA|nr:nucleotidyltransferase family protein [Thermoleophilaceae bacterium]MBA3839950.1 nucleotidyltransferase family protein [Thermoleophilaceae bacterium]
MIGALVLAAGAARRYGSPKQLAELDGRPLLEHALEAVAAAPVDRRVVVLGAGAEGILARVRLHGAEPVLCPDWEDGQAASLQAGLRALEGADAVVVVLGDQPLLSPRAIVLVLAERGPGAEALRATYAGVTGHPIVLERSLFPRLLALRGDAGARDVLREVAVRDVPCDGLGRPDDVDTPEQLEVLRS